MFSEQQAVRQMAVGSNGGILRTIGVLKKLTVGTTAQLCGTKVKQPALFWCQSFKMALLFHLFILCVFAACLKLSVSD